MSELTVVVENGDEVRQDLARIDRRVTQKVKGESIKDFAEDLKEEIEDTAPVDTGEYKDSWELEEVEDGIILYNTTDYGKYLVFPNSQMRGVPSADDPGRGILHNVRGICFQNRSDFRDKIKNTVQKIFSRL